MRHIAVAEVTKNRWHFALAVLAAKAGVGCAEAIECAGALLRTGTAAVWLTALPLLTWLSLSPVPGARSGLPVRQRSCAD